ncbi:hypothetical protein MSAN_00308400 [Mycena sanguinolenta]|uniref:Uncharacterized protein n=1 Tax=Mycena sanguinolenta TaxID=230812 RepID=A0A8H6ZEN9_9AGAR|nr:hypothetical protein MSAN_00308400 [Mycena sanguinolenta]
MKTIDSQFNIPEAPPGSIVIKIAQDETGPGLREESGRATVAWGSSREEARRKKHLDTMGEHTIFEAEVVDAILALDIIKGTPHLTDVDIFTDCWPAIMALASPWAISPPSRPLPRAPLLPPPRPPPATNPIYTGFRRTSESQAPDTRAKEASQGSPLPARRAAIADTGNKQFSACWHEGWSRSPRFRPISLFDKTTLSAASTPNSARRTLAYLLPLSPPATRLEHIRTVGAACLFLRHLLGVKSDPKPVLRHGYARDTGRLLRCFW